MKRLALITALGTVLVACGGGGRSEKKSLQIRRADGETRTPDPIITSDVLYQLSYVGREDAV
jgi:hypothetical protein